MGLDPTRAGPREDGQLACWTRPWPRHGLRELQCSFLPSLSQPAPCPEEVTALGSPGAFQSLNHIHTSVHMHIHAHPPAHPHVRTCMGPHACAHAHTCACGRAHTHIGIHLCTYLYTQMHKYMHSPAHTCTKYMFVLTYAHTPVHAHVCIHARSCMHRHTHAHTHTSRPRRSRNSKMRR